VRRTNTRWSTCWQIDAAGAALCVGMTLLAFYFGVRPLVQRRASFAQRQQELAQRRQNASNLSSSVFALERQLRSVRQALAGCIKLESAGHVNKRIAELTEVLNECGLKVDDIYVGDTSREQRYDTIPIKLTGAGGYKNWAVFLNRLARQVPDMAVTSFKIADKPGGEIPGGQFSCELSWYAVAGPRR